MAKRTTNKRPDPSPTDAALTDLARSDARPTETTEAARAMANLPTPKPVDPSTFATPGAARAAVLPASLDALNDGTATIGTLALPEPVHSVPSLVNGKQLTLRRLLACMAVAVVGGDVLAETSGSGGGWDTLRDLKLASQSKLRPGREYSSFVMSSFLAGGHADAREALKRARAHVDALAAKLAALPMTGAHRSAVAAKMGGDMVELRRGAHPSTDVRYVVGGAYWLSAPALLPAWVLDLPIPDKLREDGLAARVAHYEAVAVPASST